MVQVLILRPEPGASATVAKARALGLDAIAIPLFEIEPVPWKAPDPAGFDGLVLTSANAVRHGGAQLDSLRDLPVYAVGEATASAAREAGFNVPEIGDSGVDQLLASIGADLRLLHLCGVNRREPANVHHEITPVAVYRSRELEPPDLSGAGDSIALIHSPRAGQRFAELMSDRDAIAIVAISRAAADAAGMGWKSVDNADQATDDALLALAASLCNKPDPK